VAVVVAEGVVEITADASGVPRSVDRSLSGANAQVGAAGGRSGKAFLGGLVAAIGVGALLGIGTNIGQTISQGVRAGFDFTLEGVGLASNLAETRDAIGEVFGTASTGIERFASTANTQLGMTQQQTLDAAKNFGIFGSSAGLTGRALDRFSTDFVTLASDLAAFNDDPNSDRAIMAIGAALRGESEPIRSYGVLLDDATLKARAMKLGIIETTKDALTPQQKVLAAQAEIYAQTGTQQGNFLKTSDGLAGQQKILAASFEEAQTSLGNSLLPAMTTFVTFANDNLLPILDDVIGDIGPLLADALQESTPAFLDLIEAIVPLLPKLIDLGVKALPGIIQAIEIILPLILDWVEHTAGIFDILDGFFQFLNGDITLQELAGRIEDAGGAMLDLLFVAGTALGELKLTVAGALRDAVTSFFDFRESVGEAIAGAVGFVVGLPGRAVSALGSLGSILYGAGRSLIQGFLDGMGSMLGRVGGVVGGVMDFVKGFFPSSPAERGPFSGSGWAGVKASGGALLDQFTSGADGVVDIRSRISSPQGALSAARQAASAATRGANGDVGGGMGGGGTVINLTQRITSSDPLLASRQAARELNRYMGVA
jgi:hypothetical protein